MGRTRIQKGCDEHAYFTLRCINDAKRQKMILDKHNGGNEMKVRRKNGQKELRCDDLEAVRGMYNGMMLRKRRLLGMVRNVVKNEAKVKTNVKNEED